MHDNDLEYDGSRYHCWDCRDRAAALPDSCDQRAEINEPEELHHGKIEARKGERKNCRRCCRWVQKIENGVVGGYKKIEEGVTGTFQKVEDGFVDRFLTREGETVSDAKKRLHEEQVQRETAAKEAMEKRAEEQSAHLEASRNRVRH